VTIRCPVCVSCSISTKLTKDGVDILGCRDCRLAFWIPGPDFRPEDIYRESYFEGTANACGYDDYSMLEQSLHRNFSDRIARIPTPRAGARLLDVGAAYGLAVGAARSLGWRAVGAEISAAAANRSAKHAAGRVIVADAHHIPFPAETFDAVTMWDVLEHLSDPHRTISEAARVLRPGGRLVLSTGDVGSALARLSHRWWHLYTLPEHLFFFSRASLRILLERNGLEVEEMRAYGARYPLGYLFERITKTVLRRLRSQGTESSSPASKIALPVNLFDIVTVSGVRR